MVNLKVNFLCATRNAFKLLPFICLLISAMVLCPRNGFSATTRGDFEGNVLIVHEDDFEHKKFQHIYVLKTNTGRKRILLTEKQARDYRIKTGAHIKIKNAVHNSHADPKGFTSETLELDSASLLQIVTDPLDPRANGTFGPVPTLVVLVNFSDDKRQPFTIADTQAMFTTVSNFFKENSSGQSWLTGVTDPSAPADVVGWLTIPDTASCDAAYLDPIGDHVDEAATQAGVDLSKYTRKVYLFPYRYCSSWGQVGENPSRAWINSGLFSISTIEHEMGHNFGLEHSHSMPCRDGQCAYVEYGDTWDTMGSGGNHDLTGGIDRSGPHFNAYQKELLGWLDYISSPRLSMVGTSSNYYISAYELNDGYPKGLKIIKSTANNTFYYVEYRKPVGLDQYSPEAVIVHANGPSVEGWDENFLWKLYDSDPPNQSNYILYPGQAYWDPTAGVSITLNGIDSSTGLVNIGVTTKALNLAFVPSSPRMKEHVQKGFVWITAQISGNDNFLYGGANVKFVLHNMDGGKDIHGRALTNGAGKASLRVPRGSYRITASSTVSGVNLTRTKTLVAD